jgi:hypothetical protein
VTLSGGARSRPCDECPWRRDVKPGQFPATRYDALENTHGADGQEAPYGAPFFGCHKSPEGREFACAGWLAVEGYNHIGVRVAVAYGHFPGSALAPGEDWPELFGSYAEMAAAQGAA